MVDYCVIGECMLDVDLEIDDRAENHESPGNWVLKSHSAEIRLGGAGNTASILRRIVEGERSKSGECGVWLVYPHGGWPQMVGELLLRQEIYSRATLLEGWTIPIKIRFSKDQGETTSRWDVERVNTCGWALAKAADACRLVDPDVVVISDYRKGLFSPEFDSYMWVLREWAVAHDVPVIVDFKPQNYQLFVGRAEAVAPNLREAKELISRHDPSSDLVDPMQIACLVMEIMKVPLVAITLGSNGAAYSSVDSGHGVVAPTQIGDYCVGAGDAFTAWLAYEWARRGGENHLEIVRAAVLGATEYTMSPRPPGLVL